MNSQDSNMAANAISEAAWQASNAIQQAASGHGTPSVIYRPNLHIDGNQWCALYGGTLQDGVAGFGDSPAQAMQDFDKAWYAPLPNDKGTAS